MIEITSEMKAKCMSKFSFSITDACPKCALSFPGADCACDGSGEYQKQVVVPWDTCKEIYKAMLACSPVPAEFAALKKENDAFREERKDLIGELHRFALTEQALKARVAELEGDNKRLVEYAAIQGIDLRDNSDHPEASIECWRYLTDNIQQAINAKAEEIDRAANES